VIRTTVDVPPATMLRRGILALVALGVAGTALELLFLGHWGSAGQTIVWPALILLAAGAATLAARPSPMSIRAVRAIAVAVSLVALVGIGFHVSENLTAGPLDRDFADVWASMSPFEQLWQAVTGGVGPAPTLAPGVLLQLGFGLLLATIRHPAAVPEAVGRPVAPDAVPVAGRGRVTDSKGWKKMLHSEPTSHADRLIVRSQEGSHEP
jgi:hypothetical protein